MVLILNIFCFLNLTQCTQSLGMTDVGSHEGNSEFGAD